MIYIVSVELVPVILIVQKISRDLILDSLLQRPYFYVIRSLFSVTTASSLDCQILARKT